MVQVFQYSLYKEPFLTKDPNLTPSAPMLFELAKEYQKATPVYLSNSRWCGHRLLIQLHTILGSPVDRRLTRLGFPFGSRPYIFLRPLLTRALPRHRVSMVFVRRRAYPIPWQLMFGSRGYDPE